MVAYSFKSQFVPLVESGQKLQTIRNSRKRHARVDEPIQLYAGMRTKSCRKLTAIDPICTGVYSLIFHPGQKLEIGGFVLSDSAVEEIAIADGFKCAGDFWQFFGETKETIDRFLIMWKIP
jgi:hypothetical protein